MCRVAGETSTLEQEQCSALAANAAAQAALWSTSSTTSNGLHSGALALSTCRLLSSGSIFFDDRQQAMKQPASALLRCKRSLRNWPVQ